MPLPERGDSISSGRPRTESDGPPPHGTTGATGRPDPRDLATPTYPTSDTPAMPRLQVLGHRSSRLRHWPSRNTYTPPQLLLLGKATAIGASAGPRLLGQPGHPGRRDEGSVQDLRCKRGVSKAAGSTFERLSLARSCLTRSGDGEAQGTGKAGPRGRVTNRRPAHRAPMWHLLWLERQVAPAQRRGHQDA